MTTIRQLALLPNTKDKLIKQTTSPRKVVGRFLLLGAGVQSSTLAEMIVEGDCERVDMAIFADTGNEPPWVYAQVDYLKERLASVNVPLETVNNGHILNDLMGFRHEWKRFASIPLYTVDANGKRGMLRRQCTNEYKIRPVDDAVLNWLIENQHAKVDSIGRRRVNRDIAVEYVYGISQDENQRAKTYMGSERDPKWKHHVYPLLDKQMTRRDCIVYLMVNDLKIPRKSSCLICPYHEDEFFRDLHDNIPDLFEKICQFDDWTRSDEAQDIHFAKVKSEVYVHRSCVPLRNIDWSNPQGRQVHPIFAELLNNTCGSDGGFSCWS